MSIQKELESLINIEEPLITALSNAAALLYSSLERVNWCGFYLYDGKLLVLGPFGGKPACTVIPIDKGVCGAAATKRQTIRVANVDEFLGHITCDVASQSEIVVPLILSDGSLFGVLDVDAPITNRFSADDQRELEAVVKVLIQKIETIIERTGSDLLPLHH